MLTIQDIEVKRAYPTGKYWEPKYETKLSLLVRGNYTVTTFTLTDEQTDKVIAFIVEMARTSLTFEHAKPMDAPVDDEVAEAARDQAIKEAF